MKTVVVRKFDRASKDVIDILRTAGTATVHEAMGRIGLMKPYMRPIYPGAAATGSAVTVLAQPGDNWMIHVGIEQCRPGDIMVVGVTADNTDGMFGELLGTSMQSHGAAGLVIDAGCRDVGPLKDMGFPVWSRAISAKGTVKAVLGNVNMPVVCAGVTVHAGDVVVADDDGVVIVPCAIAETVARASAQRLEKESRSRERLKAGELSLDINAMRPQLEKLGLTYVDTYEDAMKLDAAS
ncbi:MULTISPECIES: 4-carboxy-4-hydroxy-2-oxoadipate aldolase/oxaloacetate decarboxylase [Paraburkholderia]|uniref:4-carboxy-4-hydroxy-2-oxoadipate aldolase/oxaloacetate decarboxylase n=1 Tax=Paraburkholderia TaxID=1822464 RepID=UPI001B096704|nr:MULTISPECIES: 4-carboxy-4-hydroxy-2-oxoadipate aldolase/oxaloacetate decarboxylase [Paraburkholderia]MCX4158862.1 4-carboxy-4-hydroxy-2-oxoadipate aldolase/oxaloacetate decarboxylase [Paraburkholderia aspalathi]MDN7168262.1 4-carboxy-4-hydroxy-2-oxoadipate aldolase/oxaloacetate decarboxylase [Paraburkholderia sp. SECH2]MDQ6396749.1 4-carboxy-4-hydroxy-2-oxoadipate aldolase/oxaloacetate decarboxylase [Paraburkholderia aspalathi]CAE6703607.1 4-hydroxy-4-methyl-2-oxoglutarate aldolase/4-carboxy